VTVAMVGMALAQSGRRRSDSGVDQRAAHNFFYFSRIIKTGSNLEIENGCLTLL
jgi:hypothetical protein